PPPLPVPDILELSLRRPGLDRDGISLHKLDRQQAGREVREMSEERKDRAETRGGSGMDLTLRPIPSPQSDPLFDAVIGFLGETGNEIRDEPIRPNPLREPSGGDGIPVVPPVTPPQYPKRWLVVSWFSAALTLSGMWMFDEILTLARYCGLLCPYN